MFFTTPLLQVVVLGLVVAKRAVDISQVAPTITLDDGTFVGVGDGTINRFLAIPFAKPPVGDLRFRLPVPNEPYTGVHSAANFGSACIQQLSNLPLPPGPASDAINFFVSAAAPLAEAEDCLTVNVWTPASAKANAKLPVVAWMFGGGFVGGSPSSYDGSVIVRRSLEIHEAVVYVSFNYRVSALGFLAGKEVSEAGVGNLGLQDQRQALRWISKYISAVGGDPSKVTLWGQSAGAISVSLHMLANGGNAEGLFRGAFMDSGSPSSIMSDQGRGQQEYDAFVQAAGCANEQDGLTCLRSAPLQNVKAAMDASPGIYSYQSHDLAWAPRVDGKFLTAAPQNLILNGSVANVPFVTGDVDDEGTLFSLSSLNITTDSAFRDYITQFFLLSATNAEMDRLLDLYPSDPAQGSPFDTGNASAITPDFKRIAAFLGDFTFQAPRRFLLQQRSGKQNAWSFISKRLKPLPTLGSAHGTDLATAYAPGDLTDYLIHFVNFLDPNGKGSNTSLLTWPKYNASSNKTQLLTLLDGTVPLALSNDTYREEALAFIVQLVLEGRTVS